MALTHTKDALQQERASANSREIRQPIALSAWPEFRSYGKPPVEGPHRKGSLRRIKNRLTRLLLQIIVIIPCAN
jgi:hypothetical protein